MWVRYFENSYTPFFYFVLNGRFSYLCQRLYGLRVQVLRFVVNTRHLDNMYLPDRRDWNMCYKYFNIIQCRSNSDAIQKAWLLEGEEHSLWPLMLLLQSCNLTIIVVWSCRLNKDSPKPIQRSKLWTNFGAHFQGSTSKKHKVNLY